MSLSFLVENEIILVLNLCKFTIKRTSLVSGRRALMVTYVSWETKESIMEVI